MWFCKAAWIPAALVNSSIDPKRIRKVGFPKTSGSRGIHVNVRIVARWGFVDVRRAALALARPEMEADVRAMMRQLLG